MFGVNVSAALIKLIYGTNLKRSFRQHVQGQYRHWRGVSSVCDPSPCTCQASQFLIGPQQLNEMLRASIQGHVFLDTVFLHSPIILTESAITMSDLALYQRCSL